MSRIHQTASLVFDNFLKNKILTVSENTFSRREKFVTDMKTIFISRPNYSSRGQEEWNHDTYKFNFNVNLKLQKNRQHEMEHQFTRVFPFHSGTSSSHGTKELS